MLARDKIIQEILRQARNQPEVAVAYLLGSYADGTATHLSDVDVGIGVYPSLCQDKYEALEVAGELKWGLTEALFPDNEADVSDWIFDPVEVVLLNALSTVPSLPWMLATAVPVYVPDPAFRAALEELAFAGGRPTPEQARVAAWRRKASWIVRAARQDIPCEMLLRTCLNLAHKAVVMLNLPVPAKRQDLPRVLAEAGVISGRCASFLMEAVELGDDADMQARRHLSRGLHLLADYAFQVEEALEKKWRSCLIFPLP